MTDAISPAEFKQRFFKHLDDSPFVMLSVRGSTDHHGQPMTAQVHKDRPNALYFFTASDTGFARAAAASADAMICHSAKGHDFFSYIHGTLSIDNDPTTIDALWSPMVAAWFEHGRDDPKLTLLRMDLGAAQFWEAGKGSFFKEMMSLLWNETPHEEALKHTAKTSFAA